MTRIAVILHERRGRWAAQFRPRLHDRPVRWFETRSTGGLEAALEGRACSLVVIDLGSAPETMLVDLQRASELSPGSLVLVLDPEAHDGLEPMLRELGATHVVSGFLPPPEIAALVDRWIGLAIRRTQGQGWSRSLVPDFPLDAEAWLEALAMD